MKLSLSTKTVCYFLVIVLIGTISSTVTYYNINKISEEIKTLETRDLPLLLKSNRVAINAGLKATNARGYIITSEKEMLENFKKKAEESTKLEMELAQLSYTEQGKKMSSELKTLDDNYTMVVNKIVSMINAGNYEGAKVAVEKECSPAVIALTNKANESAEFREKQIHDKIEEAIGNMNSIANMALIFSVISAILGILIGFISARSIARPVNALACVAGNIAGGNLAQNVKITRNDEIGELQQSLKDMVINLRDVIKNVQSSADNVAASSEQLTASADQSSQAANSVAVSIMEVAQGAEKQLIIVGETVNTAEKMSAEAEQIASNANIVASTSGKTAQSADQGRKAVETAINQMAFIQKTVEDLAQEITGLGVRSKEIGQIVETISGIAAQTNLLALNAAIEAARAGEQGRGFAVVAEEVRKLAEQSQEAAKQISSLIGAIQVDTDKSVQAMEAGTREVKTGAELVDNAGAAFKEIAELVNQTTSQVREISESIHHMANDSQTIVIGAQEINIVTRNTSGQTQSVSSATEEQLASMQEIASASQALAKRAEELQAITRKFVL